MSQFSTFLFASPSFFEGMSRVLDMGATLDLYNSSLTGKQADFWALYNDWRAVGRDIRQVEIEEYHRLVDQGDGNVQPARSRNT
jgi:hypothetical protein